MDLISNQLNHYTYNNGACQHIRHNLDLTLSLAPERPPAKDCKLIAALYTAYCTAQHPAECTTQHAVGYTAQYSTQPSTQQGIQPSTWPSIHQSLQRGTLPSSEIIWQKQTPTVYLPTYMKIMIVTLKHTR